MHTCHTRITSIHSRTCILLIALVHADENGLHQPKPAAAKIDVSFTGPRPVYTPSVNESAKLPGIYVVEYQVIGAGTYHMNVTVAGRHVEGSPFELVVSPLTREPTKVCIQRSNVHDEINIEAISLVIHMCEMFVHAGALSLAPFELLVSLLTRACTMTMRGIH